MRKIPLISFAFWFSILGVISAMTSGLGTGTSLWTFRTGLRILRYSVYTGIAVVFISSAGLVVDRKGSKMKGFLSLLFGLIVAGIPWSWMQIAKKVPAIHDITTDTENPPAFFAILPLRMNALNPSVYGGREISEKQKAAYPDIVTLKIREPVESAFPKALSAAKKMGWEIVDSNSKEGRIEATAVTFWFRFKDDVVVRVLSHLNGSKIDVRSVSRVGKGDVGTNARRIRKYLNLIKKEMD